MKLSANLVRILQPAWSLASFVTRVIIRPKKVNSRAYHVVQIRQLLVKDPITRCSAEVRIFNGQCMCLLYEAPSKLTPKDVHCADVKLSEFWIKMTRLFLQPTTLIFFYCL